MARLNIGDGVQALECVQCSNEMIFRPKMDTAMKNKRNSRVFEQQQPASTGYSSLWRESVAVAVFSAGVTMALVVLGQLELLLKSEFHAIEFLNLSVAGKLPSLSSFLPISIHFNTSPGFFLSQAGVLFLFQSTLSLPVPNLSYRICEFWMARMKTSEMVKVVLVHLAIGAIGLNLSKSILPEFMKNHTLVSIPYEKHVEGAEWGFYFMKEMFTMAIFVVGLLVLPTLLLINHMSPWWTAVLVYPIYFISVDPNGLGSTLNPAFLFAQGRLLEETSCCFWEHMLPQLLGGFLAGRITNQYFPDDKQH